MNKANHYSSRLTEAKGVMGHSKEDARNIEKNTGTSGGYRHEDPIGGDTPREGSSEG